MIFRGRPSDPSVQQPSEEDYASPLDSRLRGNDSGETQTPLPRPIPDSPAPSPATPRTAMSGKQRNAAAVRNVDRIETADDNVQHFRRGLEALIGIFWGVPHGA